MTARATNSVITYTTSNESVIVPQGNFYDSTGKLLSISYSKTGKLQFNGEIATIGNYAFHNCKNLTSVILPNSVTNIGYFAFSTCETLTTPIYNSTIFARLPIIHKESFDIPDGILAIASGALRNCTELPSVTIPQTVTTIGKSAFFNCKSLSTITIPNSVTSIGDNAFRYCNLTSIIAEGKTPASIQKETFKDIDKTNCILYVPYGSKIAYQSTSFWNEFKNIVELDTNISFLDNAIYVNRTEGRIGGSKEISVRMKNNYAVKGFQFVMEFPEGITINNCSLSENRMPSGSTTNDVKISSIIEGNIISVTCSLNQDNDSFTGNEDEIVSINVSFDENMEEGTYPIYLTDCFIEDVNNKNNNLNDFKSSLVLESYILGDANRDGKLRIGDATSILNFIVNNKSENFNERAADANEDGNIRVGDAILILNTIIKQ